MKTITFNTGRSYGPNGQPIVATLHDDNVVTFFDHARKVDGYFVLQDFDEFNAKTVQHYYDRGLCKNDSRSFSDGMSRTGVNSSTMNPNL